MFNIWKYFSSKEWMFWRKRRHLVTFLVFLGFFNIYTLRVTLNVAVVAMTSSYPVTLDNGTVVQVQDFNWDSNTRAVVLSSFFWGYIWTQILGGWLGARVGGSKVFGAGVFVAAFSTVLIPPLARVHVYLLVATRVIQGFFEGGTYPCLQALWARWAPPQERTLMVGVAFSGIPVGTVLGLQVTGLIGSYLGWAYMFYVTGAVGLAWVFVFLLVVKDDPGKDPHISDQELKYIKDSIGDSETELNSVSVKYPWRKIATSIPLWAIIVANFCNTWTHYTVLTQLPTYMDDIFGFDLTQNGLLTSLPYIMMGITMHVCGGLSDWLKNKNVLTTTQVRKLFVCGAYIGQGTFLFLAGRSKTPQGAILSLIGSVGLESLALTSYYCNTLDLAPQQASVLFGLSNTAGSLSGTFSPLLTGVIVTDKNAEQWQIVFYISSCIVLSGALFYGLFGSAERLSWSVEEEQPRPNKYAETI